MDLCSLSTIRAILEKNGLRMQKSLGQNFLINPAVPEAISEAVRGADTVLEIGPGIGCLTAELCRRVPRVIAVEIDRGLIPVLSETLAEYDNVTVINEDVLKLDLHEVLKDAGSVAVCANLPYYITTPILMHLIECGIPFTQITVMVQKEVADRLAAAPGKAEYGAVSIAVQAYGAVRRELSVPAGNFFPAPKVDSAVISVVPHAVPPFTPVSKEKYRNLVRAAFTQRRKKLSNGIRALYPALTKEQIDDAVTGLGLPADVRGERLSPKEFSDLLDALEAAK